MKTRDLLSMLVYFLIGIIALAFVMQILGGIWRLITWLIMTVLGAAFAVALGFAVVLLIKMLYGAYRSTK